MKTQKTSKPNKTKPKMNDSGENALDIGLGSITAEQEALKRKNELSLSMAERLHMKTNEEQYMSETKRLKVRGQGSVKEVSFIPKSSRKSGDKKNHPIDDKIDRSRRGIRELGFRTPFKHHK